MAATAMVRFETRDSQALNKAMSTIEGGSLRLRHGASSTFGILKNAKSCDVTLIGEGSVTSARVDWFKQAFGA